jgi:hypothetical protein
MYNDNLSAARGILNALAIGISMWAISGLIVWCPWWSHRAWRSALRPWNEPNYFKDVFASPRIAGLRGLADSTIATEECKLTFGCQCNSLTSRFKRLFTPEPKIVGVAEISKAERAENEMMLKAIFE